MNFLLEPLVEVGPTPELRVDFYKTFNQDVSLMSATVFLFKLHVAKLSKHVA